MVRAAQVCALLPLLLSLLFVAELRKRLVDLGVLRKLRGMFHSCVPMSLGVQGVLDRGMPALLVVSHGVLPGVVLSSVLGYTKRGGCTTAYQGCLC